MRTASNYACHKANPYIPLSGSASCRGEECRECNYCGWNPEVNERRRRMIRQKMAEENLERR